LCLLFGNVRIKNRFSPITNDYLGEILKSKSWAFVTHFYSWLDRLWYDDIGDPEVISYFCQPFGIIGELLSLDSPAIVISNYDQGRGVYFSMDIGRSAYRGYNNSAWIELCTNSLKWLSYSDANPILADNKDYITPEIYLSNDFISLALNNEFPSILYNEYGAGRKL